MNLRWGIACALSVASLSGCGNKLMGLPPLEDGGGGGDGSQVAIDMTMVDAPLITGDFATADDAPLIVPVLPMDGAEVKGDILEVRATITARGGSAIDGSTVAFSIPSAGAPNNQITTPLSLSSTPNVYIGQVDISGINAGPSNFVIVASDLAGRQASLPVNYIHDHGPLITFAAPTQDTAKGSINVELVIYDPVHPVAASDVTATVRNKGDVTLTAVPGADPLRLTGVINFADYSPPLDGLQLILAEAKNSAGTPGQATKTFTVDNVGPVITPVSPVAGDFIGGVVQIEADVTDESGVNDSSVVITFGGDPANVVHLRRSGSGSDRFVGVFDVRQLGRNFVFPVSSFRAADKLGNQSDHGLQIIIDNTPPIASLDPPPMQMIKYGMGNTLVCSQPFDPVGDESANDGAVVPQIEWLKARVEDFGNDAPGLVGPRAAGLDKTNIQLVLIPAANAPLAVDTDGDGECDDSNPTLIPTSNPSASNEALVIQMAPMTEAGAADFNCPMGGLPCGPPTGIAYDSICDSIGDGGGTEPTLLCDHSGSDLTVAIGKPVRNARDPGIWSIPPIVSDAYNCAGLQFDSLNNLPEGPVCAVVTAVDSVGNHSVSTPLRLCIDRGAHLCGSFSAGSAPNCTGTYNPVSMTTSSTACTPRKFGDHDFYFP